MPTAGAIIEECEGYIRELSGRAAAHFGDDFDDWYQETCLEIVKFAGAYDPSRGALTTWVHLRWLRLVGLRKRPHLKRNRRLPTLDLTSAGEPRTDERARDPADEASSAAAARQVRDLVATLKPRQRACVGWQFGLTPGPATQAGLAAELGVARTRVQALVLAGLAALAPAFGADPRGVASSARAARMREARKLSA
jgi:hypothetical protein